MSHISSYETEIRLSPESRVDGKLHPSWKMMRRALEAVAEDKGGSVEDEIKDYFGRARKVDFALITPRFPAGIGVDVSGSGEVRFLYDEYGVSKTLIEELRDEIIQSYTALAVTEALKSLNYDVELDEARSVAGRKQVTVRGIL